jgi:hypothetical protein
MGCDDDGLTTAQSPDYVVRPNEVVFPTLVVGLVLIKEVEIENIGAADLLISDFVIQSNESIEGELNIGIQDVGDDGYTNVEFERSSDGSTVNQSFNIPPGEILKVQVKYQPQDETPENAAIYFNSNVVDPDDAGRSRIAIPISVTGGEPQVQVSPLQLDFDVVPAGTDKTLDVIISNVGASVLQITQIRIDGSQDFTPLIEGRDPRRQPDLLLDPDRDDVPGIAPFIEGTDNDGRLTIQVRYAPVVAGPDSASLVISSNAQEDIFVDLVANSRNPCLDVVPQALEFPASLVNRSDSRPISIESCGGAALTISEIYIEDNQGNAFAIEEEQELPLIMPAAPPQGLRPSQEIPISFRPTSTIIYNGTLVIKSDDPVMPERRINLLGRGSDNICPQARVAVDEFNLLPLDTVVLDGSPSVDQDGPGNVPQEYEWAVISRPEGSISQPVESFNNPQQPSDGGLPDDITTPYSLFFIDLPGIYTLELNVRDQFGLDSLSPACDNPAVVTIVAEPEEAIQVQLTWEAGNELDLARERAGDLDLHFTHPNADGFWFGQPYDCFFRNPTPDWGQSDNPQDNPFLDLDDFNGNGPENLRLAVPEDTDILQAEYLVGVDYYNHVDRIDRYEYGSVLAHIRIFIDGVLAWDYTDDDAPGYKEMQTTGHFWEAASIAWPSGIVTTIDRYYEERPGQE